MDVVDRRRCVRRVPSVSLAELLPASFVLVGGSDVSNSGAEPDRAVLEAHEFELGREHIRIVDTFEGGQSCL
jgi:hypothetical protein